MVQVTTDESSTYKVPVIQILHCLAFTSDRLVIASTVENRIHSSEEVSASEVLNMRINRKCTQQVYSPWRVQLGNYPFPLFKLLTCLLCLKT